MARKTSFGDKEGGQTRLIRALRSEPDDETCQACLDRLNAYIAAQFAGEDYMARFAEVVVHLDVCLDCASAYARLYELELAEATNRLPQPDHLPDPDLDFLGQGATETLSSTIRQTPPQETHLIEQLRNALHRTGERLVLQFSTDLLNLLRPFQMAARRSAPADSGPYGGVLFSLKPAQMPTLDLPITLTVYQDAHQSAMCLVEIVVEPSGQSWPNLDGRVVTLSFVGEKLEAVTDAWGVASFEGIWKGNLADMTLEVTLTK